MVTPTDTPEFRESPDFIIASEVMRKFMDMVARVAHQCGTVLIMGETGTGKERIAHTIHEHSRRRAQPFVDINCAALPEHLVESELFGYEKGAFSGADATKPGLFELAHSGTLFLDEIGELDLKVQVKLLRVLDRAPYYRLGGHRKVIADVRVVAATNRDLKEEVRAGRFRKDLYHRLSQFELHVPPLRDRAEDISAIASRLLSQGPEAVQLSRHAIEVLLAHGWPGNVRELQNVVTKLRMNATGPEIDAAAVSRELGTGEAEETGCTVKVEPRSHGLQAGKIRAALEITGGHRGQAAVQLGISRRTLSRKLRDFGLSNPRPVATGTLGPLSDEERHHFRAEICVPASVSTPDGRHFACTTSNVGASGMGLEGMPAGLGHRSSLRICFQFPGASAGVEITAVLAWIDRRGNAGILFTDRDPEARRAIYRWLCLRMAEEGWSAPASAAEPVGVNAAAF